MKVRIVLVALLLCLIVWQGISLVRARSSLISVPHLPKSMRGRLAFVRVGDKIVHDARYGDLWASEVWTYDFAGSSLRMDDLPNGCSSIWILPDKQGYALVCGEENKSLAIMANGRILKKASLPKTESSLKISWYEPSNSMIYMTGRDKLVVANPHNMKVEVVTIPGQCRSVKQSVGEHGNILAAENKQGISVFDMSKQKIHSYSIDGYGVAVSSDGRTLAYENGREPSIVICSSKEGRLTEKSVVRIPYIMHRIAWSPDGKYLIGDSTRTFMGWTLGERTLNIIDPSAGKTWKLPFYSRAWNWCQ